MGPFVLVGVLICVEFGYVNSTWHPGSSPTLPRFLKWALRLECLSLLLALLNVPLMSWHLSTFGIYSRGKPGLKVFLVLAAASVYLTAVAAMFFLVIMIHLW